MSDTDVLLPLPSVALLVYVNVPSVANTEETPEIDAGDVFGEEVAPSPSPCIERKEIVDQYSADAVASICNAE